jgi:hypothetical protein
MVVAKVKEKLSVYKRVAQKFGAKGVTTEKLNTLEATEQYQFQN